jgi:hypothetical protein
MIYAVAGLATLFALAGIVLLLRDRAAAAVSRVRNPPEKIKAAREEFERRLEQPDWQAYELHLGRAVPTELREWFSSAGRLSASYQFKDYYVTYAPIDSEGEKEAAWVLPGIMPFASSDGDPIFLKPGSSESDAVHIAYHDGGGTEELAPSVNAFLNVLSLHA